jgi:DNA-binding NarL/FixJ family response regulator
LISGEIRGEVVDRLRVLLADDNEAVLDEVRAVLEPEFDVVGAVADGQAMLEEAEKLEPDVLVVDISMPVLGGIQAVQRLKKGAYRPKAIVFLTVHQDPALVEAALRAGGLGYVVKMSAGEDLVVAIREALQGRRYVSPMLEL